MRFRYSAWLCVFAKLAQLTINQGFCFLFGFRGTVNQICFRKCFCEKESMAKINHCENVHSVVHSVVHGVVHGVVHSVVYGVVHS